MAIRSTATDPQGITRVELLVDGVTVRTDPSPVAQGQAQFSLIQTWKATTPGTHTLTVRAFNTSGTFADGGVTVVVNQSVALEPTATSASATTVTIETPVVIPTLAQTGVAPTAVPTAAAATNTSAPAACVPNSAFVADITIPDGTVVAPGTSFTKTWRVRNNGTCGWDNSYSIVYVGGEQFGGPAGAAIAARAPGSVLDISLPLVAPNTPGTHTSVWRLRASNGALFGTNLTVVIVIPSPATAIPPTATSTKTPTSAPPGSPNIPFFNCSPCTIIAGGSSSLSWGAVTGATNVTIDPDIGGVATPGNVSVSPTSTTTYTMTAIGPGGTTQRTVAVTVVGNFAGSWIHNFGTMNLSQNGASVTGTYYNGFVNQNGTVAGNISGNTLTGTYSLGGGMGSIQFTLLAGGRFNGNWGVANKWCGAKPAVSFPAGCSFAGAWLSNVSGLPPPCAMNLTRTGTAVTGSYCNGTISGTISYVGGETVLTGNWFAGGGSNSIKFYLLGYNALQFQGDFSGNFDWCGWRSSSSAPSPCGRVP